MNGYTSYPVQPGDYEAPHIVSEAAIRRAIASAIDLKPNRFPARYTDAELFDLIGLSEGGTWFGPGPEEGGLIEGDWSVDGPLIGILVTEES